LWHGFNDVFLLSLLTIVLGMTIFVIALYKKQFLIKWRSINNHIFIIEFTNIFNQLLDGFLNFSERNTKRLQHGYHRFYILTVIVFASALLWFEVYVTRNWVLETQFSLTPLYISGLVAIITCSTIYAAIARSRIATIISMGVTGYGISLIYLYYSAVDLAITQILVETLVVVMFVLVLQRLPLFETLSSKLTRVRDLIISLTFGSVMTVLALKALNVEFNHSISDMMVKNSFVKAHGKNVVNVILVDFRALDTLGEVTVLIIAAMGVFVLLKTKKT
jgi:multicomponent Na+:H+ antiporter subunit A